jgi:hypothetical protein
MRLISWTIRSGSEHHCCTCAGIRWREGVILLLYMYRCKVEGGCNLAAVQVQV